MRVFLTGGMGYIGSHTAVELLQANHDVLLFDNLSNSTRSVVERIQSITRKSPTFIQGDIRDKDLLISTMLDWKPNAVMHFAGLKAVGESTKVPLEYYSNNVEGSISLLQAMRRCSIRVIVFSSSATVYGSPKYLPIDESHPTSSTNPYGQTKLHIEEMLSDLARYEEDWHIVCLRYFNPVGAHSTGLIGEAPAGIPNNLMPYLAQVAHGDRPYLNVFGDDYDTHDGTGVRDYIHVVDLAKGHLAALNYALGHAGWDAINLGTGRGTSVLQMIKAFELASGRRIHFNIAPRRSGDISECFASVDKANKLLGWQATRSLEDMCESTWLWQENQG